MTDKKLSQLPAGTAIQPTDLFYSAQDIGGGNFTQVKQPASAMGSFFGSGRTRISVFTQYYVATTGNDANAGSIGSPWRTIQHAVDFVSQNLVVFPEDDNGGALIQINVAAGTYTTVAGVVLPSLDNLGTGVLLVGDTTTPSNILLNTTNAFYVVSINGCRWFVRGVKFDASTDANPDTNLVIINSGPSHVLLSQTEYGKAGNAGAGNHISCLASNGGSCTVCLIDFIVSGIANSFMNLKGERFAFVSGYLQHGFAHLTIDPLWPGGTIALQRFASAFWNPDTGVTGTSSGPQLVIEPGCVVSTALALSTIPGVSSTNVIHGDVYSVAGSQPALLGGTSAFTAPDNSGTIVLKAPNSVTSWGLTLPPTAGTNLYVLQTNGSGVTTWVPQSGGGGTPGGAFNTVQYNNAGVFGGIGPLTNGQLVIGSTGVAPVAAALTAGANITITNAAGAITIASTGGASTPLPQWNPIAKGTHNTLSSGNSVVTGDGTANHACVLDVAGSDGGKWYAECKVVIVTGQEAFGLGDASTNLNLFLGGDNHSWAYFDSTTTLFHGGAGTVTVTTPVAGDVIQIAWDADTGNLFFGLNNVWQNAANPVTETFPCFTGVFGLMYIVGCVRTTGQLALQTLVYSPPQGYSPWGLANQGTRAVPPNNSVQYDANGGLGGAANFFISSGNPNVTSGNAYLYNGTNAIRADTVGKNWFLGNSGNLTLTGTDNFCEGDASGNNLTSGAGNMGMGRATLNQCTTGIENVAIGKFALLAATTGSANTGIGTNSLLACIDGANNTGVGGGTIATSQHDSDNVGIGLSALGLLNGGSRNIGIGSQSLVGLTAANHNVGIGHGAGGSATSGSDNTLIGYFAGRTSPFGGPDITTGAQNICIGSQCAVPTGTASGQISIGNMIYGTGCTGQNGTVSTGKIGIGLAAPAVELDTFGRIGTRVYSAATTGLPAAGNKGARAFVSDATANTFNTAYTSGGANNVPVFDDGAAWRVG